MPELVSPSLKDQFVEHRGLAVRDHRSSAAHFKAEPTNQVLIENTTYQK